MRGFAVVRAVVVGLLETCSLFFLFVAGFYLDGFGDGPTVRSCVAG